MCAPLSKYSCTFAASPSWCTESTSGTMGVRAGSFGQTSSPWGAAPQGGNCPLTEPGRTVIKHGVTLVGETNLPALVAADASSLYARNVLDFLNASEGWVAGEQGLSTRTQRSGAVATARVIDRLGEREFNKVSKLLASLGPAQVASLLRADAPTLRGYVWTWLATTKTGGCHLGCLLYTSPSPRD